MSTPSHAADAALDEQRRRARRRLVGAVVLALVAAVVVPMLLENEPRPLGEDVSVRIPPVDEGKFVNRLNTPGATPAAKAPGKVPEPKSAEPKPAEAKAGEPKPAEAKATETKAPPAAIPSPDAKPAEERSAPSAPVAEDRAAAPRRTVSEAEQRVLSPATRPAPASPSSAAASPAVSESPKPAAPSTDVKAADAKPAEPKPGDAKPGETKAGDPTAPDAAKAGYAVQLAAFADDKGANALAAKLKRAGHAAYTEPYATSRGTLWRVRVGPFPTREAAESARKQLKEAGQNGMIAPAR